MSDQEEQADQMYFFMFAGGSPFFIFFIACLFFSFYLLEWALWKPFWKRFTDQVEGRVDRRSVREVTIQDDGGTYRKEIKHATIVYTVQGALAPCTLYRTFEAQEIGDSNGSGGLPIGYVSLETFDNVGSLTLRLVPGLPGSAIPEFEWKMTQQPYSWSFHLTILFLVFCCSGFLGVLVPLMTIDKWKTRAVVLFIAYYLTILPLAGILCRRRALAQMKRQETTIDFTVEV